MAPKIIPVLLSPLVAIAMLAAACGSDRPPLGNTTIITPSGGGTVEESGGGGAGITIDLREAGSLCHDEAGAAVVYGRDASDDCVCPSTKVNGINVILPCGWGLCVVGGQGGFCQADRTVTLHDDCPSDGAIPPEWTPDCVGDP